MWRWQGAGIPLAQLPAWKWPNLDFSDREQAGSPGELAWKASSRGRVRLAGLYGYALLLEATAAEHGTALRRLEGDGGFRTAFRAHGARFRAGRS